MTRDCEVIINRLSGSYSDENADRVKSFLVSHGFAPSLSLIRDLDEATVVARCVCPQGRNPLLIVGGGDGTVNGVLNGLHPGAATMAVLPFGTANVLATELGIKSVDDALLKIVRGESRSASVGFIERENHGRYFLLVAGIGFDGSVVKDVGFREKRLLGKGAYVLSAIRQFAKWKKEPMEIEADGERITCQSLLVCNCSRYAGRFSIAPEASLFEPVFDVFCIQGSGRASLLRGAARLLAGRGPCSAGIRALRPRRLVVSGNRPVQVDGDYFCRAPVKISAVPDFVRLIV